MLNNRNIIKINYILKNKMKVYLILIIIIKLCLSLKSFQNVQAAPSIKGSNVSKTSSSNGIKVTNPSPVATSTVSDANLVKIKDFLNKKKKINQNITFVIPDSISCKDSILLTCITKCTSFYKIKTCSDLSCLCTNNKKLRKNSISISNAMLDPSNTTTINTQTPSVANNRKLRIQNKSLLEMYKNGIKELIENNKNFKPNFLADPNSIYHTLNNENQFKQILETLPDLVDNLN